MSLHGYQKNSFPTRSLLVLLLLFPLAGCMLLDRRYHWQEEALQQDGKSVVIERWMTRGRTGFPDSQFGPVRHQKIAYSPLGVEWTSKSASEQPLSFAIVDGVAYLMVILARSREHFCKGKVSGTYVAIIYKWEGGKMSIVDQHRAPIGLMTHNVTGISLWSGKQYKEFVSWDHVLRIAGSSANGGPIPLVEFYEREHGLRCQ